MTEATDQSGGPATEKSTSDGQTPVPEEMIEQTLGDSFPASDPPSWNMGKEAEAERDPGGKAKNK